MWNVVQEIVILAVAIVAILSFHSFRNSDVIKVRKNEFKRSGSSFSASPPSTQRQGIASNCSKALDIAEQTVPSLSACQDSRQVTKLPVLPPTFTSRFFDDQADELAQQLVPTEKCQMAVQEIVEDVRRTIHQVMPYADIVGFTSSQVSRGTAFGVAVPEVHVVANLPPQILARSVHAHVPSARLCTPQGSGKVDERKLHKSAVRMCTELLVSKASFKFRRSAFRGKDPKVTLMAPRSLNGSGSIPIDFSVNTAEPLCNAMLIAACARVDPRARMLILLVRRWAKDRGICHASKGNLSPYAWTVLCIFFLQVGVKGGSILPPLKHLRLAPGRDAT